MLAKLGRTDEAIEAYNALVDRNPGRVEYIKDLFKLKGIDFDALADESVPKALTLLGELEKRVPKGSAPTRLALNVAQGPPARPRHRAADWPRRRVCRARTAVRRERPRARRAEPFHGYQAALRG